MPMLFISLLLSSCGSKEIAYLSDAQRDSTVQIMSDYSCMIMPGDELMVEVNSVNPESVLPFNLQQLRASEGIRGSSQLNGAIGAGGGYLVDEEGDIVFPMLGKIHVSGISRDSLSHLIQQRLIAESYVADPIVTVYLTNFRVTVVGEVKYPYQFHVIGDRMTVFEALALAGDLTIYGQRTNVAVVREQNGAFVVGYIDLTSKSMLDSPYYYLQQNDIVYVEPNDRKKKTAVRNTEWPKYVSTSVAAVAAARSIWRIITRKDRYQ